jgi:hypothetical protein
MKAREQNLGNRRKQRLPGEKMTISINGKSYQVFNINEYGVGFIIDNPDEIPIGNKIKPILFFDNVPVQATGIPRHVSKIQPSGEQLHFKSGWVCGTEFTTQHDTEGWELFQQYIAENADT